MDQPTINNSSSQEGHTPFEMPPNIAAPEPMGQKPGEQKPVTPLPETSAPVPEPKKPILSYFVIIFLLILLFVGALFFARWKGWILGNNTQPTPTPVTSPKISPAISSVLPTTSPGASSSPQTTVNVNDETRKKDLANVKDALKKYYAVKAEYPSSATMIKTSDQSSVLAQALIPTYLTSLPDDPTAPQFYYGYKSDGQTFEITAALEDKSDSSGTLSGSYNIYKVTDSSTE